MIERDFIVAWRQNAPWPTDAQVEQDLVLSRALVEIFNHPLLSRELAFRGGTALHKLFLPKPARYSEDIDLVQVSEGPICLSVSVGLVQKSPVTSRSRVSLQGFTHVYVPDRG